MELPAVSPGPGRWLNDGMGAYVAAQQIKVMGLHNQVSTFVGQDHIDSGIFLIALME